MKTDGFRWLLFLSAGNEDITRKSSLSFLIGLDYKKVFSFGQDTGEKRAVSFYYNSKKKRFTFSVQLSALLTVQEQTREDNDSKSLSQTAIVISSCGFSSAFKEPFVAI